MEEKLLVGFGLSDVTPKESVPLGGFGNSSRRMSEGRHDPLSVTVTALTDGEGTTVMFVTLDLTRAYNHLITPFREKIRQATGVPEEHIMLCASHTHSGPDMLNDDEPSIVAYEGQLAEGVVKAAVAAMEDRKPARIRVGDVEATGLNFVKHYRCTRPGEEPIVYGDNYYDHLISREDTQQYSEHTTQADPTMHLVQFVREGGKDVVLVNWRAHAQLTGGSKRHYLSGDFPAQLRSILGGFLDCHVAYIQGACGNINPRSRILRENYSTDYTVYSARLAQYAVEGLKNRMRDVPAGRIRVIREIYAGKVRHDRELAERAKEITELFGRTNDRIAAVEAGAPYGIHSPYHAYAILGRSDLGETLDLELDAISVGDELAFVTAPNELFDTNSVYTEAHSPYPMTVTCGYTNGHLFYLPSQEGFAYGCYEADICRFCPGTGELLSGEHLRMLRELRKDN